MSEIILDLVELQTRANALRRQFGRESEGWAGYGDLVGQDISLTDIDLPYADEDMSGPDLGDVVSNKSPMDFRERKWTAAKLLRPLKYGVTPDMEEFSKEEVDEINRQVLEMKYESRSEWQVVDCPKTQAHQLKISRKFVRSILLRKLP